MFFEFTKGSFISAFGSIPTWIDEAELSAWALLCSSFCFLLSVSLHGFPRSGFLPDENRESFNFENRHCLACNCMCVFHYAQMVLNCGNLLNHRVCWEDYWRNRGRDALDCCIRRGYSLEQRWSKQSCGVTGVCRCIRKHGRITVCFIPCTHIWLHRAICSPRHNFRSLCSILGENYIFPSKISRAEPI